MNGFDPGDGWRQVPAIEGIGKERIVYVDAADTARHAWVREEPVPALPTVPYTVIRVTWITGDDSTVMFRTPDGEDEYEWHSKDDAWYASNITEAITGFEVLSEPRAVTAKAVLNRVRAVRRSSQAWGTAIRMIAQEYES